MAKSEKFKVLSKEEIKNLSKEDKKDYKIKLKEYKKEHKTKKTPAQKRMLVVKVVGAFMAIIMILGVLAAIFYPLIYIKG